MARFIASHGGLFTDDMERQMMELTGSTADHRKAVAAFLGKQQPTFEGR